MAKFPKKTAVINANDKLARQINRLKNKNRCERCGVSGTLRQLQWSHVHSAESKIIRWDEDNYMLHCAACHFWWHKHPRAAIKWFNEKYGAARGQRLDAKLARRPQSLSVLDYLQVQERLKTRLQKLLDKELDIV